MADLFDILAEAAKEVADATERSKMLLSKVADVEEGQFIRRPEFKRDELIHPQVFNSEQDAVRADLSTEDGREFAMVMSQIGLELGGK